MCNNILNFLFILNFIFYFLLIGFIGTFLCNLPFRKKIPYLQIDNPLEVFKFYIFLQNIVFFELYNDTRFLHFNPWKIHLKTELFLLSNNCLIHRKLAFGFRILLPKISQLWANKSHLHFSACENPPYLYHLCLSLQSILMDLQ